RKFFISLVKSSNCIPLVLLKPIPHLPVLFRPNPVCNVILPPEREKIMSDSSSLLLIFFFIHEKFMSYAPRAVLRSFYNIAHIFSQTFQKCISKFGMRQLTHEHP